MAKKPGKGKGGSSKPKKSAKWAKNSKDAAAKAKESKGKNTNVEDYYTKKGAGKRIRDLGQAVPKGYMRTGGRYFAKIANMRPIKSLTTQQQRNLFYANKDRFLGPREDAGWMRSVGNQGMYNGQTSEANFRKTSAARKMIDADGGTYPPDWKASHGTAGKKKQSKSRYIMAIGQDGHKR